MRVLKKFFLFTWITTFIPPGFLCPDLWCWRVQTISFLFLHSIWTPATLPTVPFLWTSFTLAHVTVWFFVSRLSCSFSCRSFCSLPEVFCLVLSSIFKGCPVLAKGIEVPRFLHLLMTPFVVFLTFRKIFWILLWFDSIQLSDVL